MNKELETYVKLKYFPIGVCDIPKKVKDTIINRVFTEKDDSPRRYAARWNMLCDPPADSTFNEEVMNLLIEYHEEHGT